MTDLAFIDNLHFLRPGWFFLLIPFALITLIQWRTGDLGRQWQGVIAPHLLPRMVVSGSQRQFDTMGAEFVDGTHSHSESRGATDVGTYVLWEDLVSADGEKLLHVNAYYTVNEIPAP